MKLTFLWTLLISFLTGGFSFWNSPVFNRRHYSSLQVQPMCMDMGSGQKSNDRAGPPIKFTELKSNQGHFLQALKKRSGQDSILPSKERQDIIALLDHHALQMSGKDFSATLGYIGALWSQQKAPYIIKDKSVILKSLSRTCNSMTATELCSTIIALGKLQIPWSSLTKESNLNNRLVSILPGMNEKMLGDLFWSMGSMGAKYYDMAPTVREVLLVSIDNQGLKMSTVSLSSLLWALAKLGMRWNLLSTKFRTSIGPKLLVMNKQFTSQQASKVIWALGTLGAEHDSFPKGFLESFVENVSKIKRSQMGNAVSASQALMGAAKMGASWDRCSPSLRALLWEQMIRVSYSTNDRGISNAVWAMGTIGSYNSCRYTSAHFEPIF